MKEWSLAMAELNRDGGFERADDFAFALTAFRRYLADFEYFGRCTLDGPLQKNEYVSLLGSLVTNFLGQFRDDPQCAELARETFTRSLPFWRKCGGEFEFRSYLFLANIAVRLAKHFDSLVDVQFLQERLKKDISFFNEKGVEVNDLKQILEVNASLRILDASTATKLKDQYEQFHKQSV